MGRRQDQQTPKSVTVNFEPRQHVRDATLGITVDVDRSGQPPNRLVTIGDSITQGFMSLAVFHTDRSWPAIVAHELGMRLHHDFCYPLYEPPSGPGGLPLDLERAVRGLGRVVGEKLDWHELVKAGRWLRTHMDGIEDFWERPGNGGFQLKRTKRPYHNLAVYGADVLDVQLLTSTIIDDRLKKLQPRDHFFAQLVEGDNDRAWRVVLESCKPKTSTVLDGARSMGEEGDGPHGIETLVVMVGSNNALGSVLHLEPRWTPDNYLKGTLEDRLAVKAKCNIWQPAHFAEEWARLVAEVRTIKARHVIFATVPQVTIAPIARGVRGKVHHGSRYFPYYTRPWINDDDFDKDRDPWIDEDQARGIDSAIDAFNETIISSVRAARDDPTDPRDWYVFDLAGLLDSMAVRRYLMDPAAQPTWWVPYELPPPLADLVPKPDTRFFRSGPNGREQGGIFSLDGVHPTTIASGVVAREVIRIMDRHAGVIFRRPDGTPRPPGEVDVDFDRVLQLDTLNSQPPTAITSIVSLLGWFDEKLDWVARLGGG